MAGRVENAVRAPVCDQAGWTGSQSSNCLMSTLDIVMSSVMNGKALKWSAACSAGMLTAGTFRWRPMVSAISRTPNALCPLPGGLDSASYGAPACSAARKAGGLLSVTVRVDPKVRAAIAAIPDDAWTSIRYPRAIWHVIEALAAPVRAGRRSESRQIRPAHPGEIPS